MTALLLFVLLAAGGAGYVSWAKHAIASGVPGWWFIVGAPIAYLTPVVLLVALWFLISWIWRTPRPPGAQLGAARSMRMFVDEVLAIGVSWPLMVLHRLVMRDPAPAPCARPVILVHGVLVNDGVWFGFRRRLAPRGRQRRVYGQLWSTARGYRALCSAARREDRDVCAATGAQRVVLIGHSMGGLVSRAYLRRYGVSRVEQLITIGTPHHGSLLAWSFPGRCLAQMRPGNKWLTELNRNESSPSPVPITSIWSRHDSMVIPQASSELACAENLAIVGVGHNALLGDKASLKLAVSVLKS